MAMRQVAVVATMLSIAILPQMLVIDAYAKMLPLPNPDYTFGQFTALVIGPMVASIVILVMLAIRARQNQIVTK